MINVQLNLFDFSIIIFFIALFIAWPRLFAKKADSNDADFLLMSKGLSFPLFVATLTSTWYGGILGVTQIAFEQGIYGFFTQGLFWYFAYFAFALFLSKKIRKQNVMSLPELIGQNFGPHARKFAGLILFFHALPITYAISVGLLLQLIFDISFFWAIILGVGTVAIYTALGGFKGVVFTDCLQFVLMFLAVIMVAVTCFFKFGGISFLISSLPEKHFFWRGEHNLSNAFIWLFIACTSTFIHPVFYQRCLAAKSDAVALWGILAAMAMWLVFDTCTSLGGMYARALFPKADSSTAYLVLGINILPHGLRGLFLSGVLATILSTLDSFIFVSGTSISYDLLKPKLHNHHHKLAIFGCAALLIFLGGTFGHNFEANWLLMEGAFSSTLLAPVLAAIWLKPRFLGWHFMVPATLSLLVFFIATYVNSRYILPLAPFYCAHLTSFAVLAFLLYIKPQGQAQMPIFGPTQILLKDNIKTH